MRQARAAPERCISVRVSLNGKRLSYDFAVRLGHDGLPGPGWPPRSGRKGTDRETAGRQGTGLE